MAGISDAATYTFILPENPSLKRASETTSNLMFEPTEIFRYTLTPADVDIKRSFLLSPSKSLTMSQFSMKGKFFSYVGS